MTWECPFNTNIVPYTIQLIVMQKADLIDFDPLLESSKQRIFYAWRLIPQIFLQTTN